jgi:hypothetical protein
MRLSGPQMNDWFSDDDAVKHDAFQRIAAMVCPEEAQCDPQKLQVTTASVTLH